MSSDVELRRHIDATSAGAGPNWPATHLHGNLAVTHLARHVDGRRLSAGHDRPATAAAAETAAEEGVFI